MATVVYMVRHAESPFVFGQERTRGLSEEGAAAAKRIAELFRPIDVHAVVSSPYVRARATIEGIARQKGLAIAEYEELIERPIKGLDYKTDWTTLQEAIRRSFTDLDYALEGGETTRDAQRRAIPVVEKLLADFEGRSVVVGTHGNIMTIVMNYYDSRYGYDFWASASKPDVYRLTFRRNRLEQVERMWKE